MAMALACSLKTFIVCPVKRGKSYLSVVIRDIRGYPYPDQAGFAVGLRLLSVETVATSTRLVIRGSRLNGWIIGGQLRKYLGFV